MSADPYMDIAQGAAPRNAGSDDPYMSIAMQDNKPTPVDSEDPYMTIARGKGATVAQEIMPPAFQPFPEENGTISIIPSTDDSGKPLSSQEAQDQYKRGGRKFGNYPNIKDATSAAQKFYSDSLNAPIWQSHGGTRLKDIKARPDGSGITEINPKGKGDTYNGKLGSLGDLGSVWAETLYQNASNAILRSPVELQRVRTELGRRAESKFGKVGRGLVAAMSMGFVPPPGEPDDVITKEATDWINAQDEVNKERWARLAGLGVNKESAMGQAGSLAGTTQAEITKFMLLGDVAGHGAVKPLVSAHSVVPSLDVNLQNKDISTGAALLRAGGEGLTSYALMSVPGMDKLKNSLMAKGSAATWKAFQSDAPTIYKNIFTKVLAKVGRGAALGAGVAEASQLLDKALIDHNIPWTPEWEKVKQSMASMMAFEITNGVMTGTKDIRAANTPPPIEAVSATERTHEQALGDARKAILRGDTKAAAKFEAEAKLIKERADYSGPIQLDRSQEPIGLDVKDYYPSDIREAQTAPPEYQAPTPPTPEMVPAKKSDVLSAEQVGQEDAITQLRHDRVLLQTELDTANQELEAVKQSGHRGSSEAYREANARVARATSDMVSNDEALVLHTGKSYEELQGEPSGVTPEGFKEAAHGSKANWDATRAAWEAIKSENRGRVNSGVDPYQLARLIAASIKDGAKNVYHFLDATRIQMGDEFKDFYDRIGGLEGAKALWGKHANGPSEATQSITAEGVAPRAENFYHIDAKGRISNLGTEAPDSLHPGESLLAVGKDGNPRVVDSQSGLNDQQLLERVGPKVLDLNKRASDVRYMASGLDLTPELQAVADTVKAKLGLPEGSPNADLVSWVKLNIGELGSSIKETTVKIMNKIKGITRDLATALAEHLHEAVSGSRESQLGAIGRDIKDDKILGAKMAKSAMAKPAEAPAEKPAYSTAEEKAYQDARREHEAIINRLLPSNPENREARAKAFSRLPSRASVAAGLRGGATPVEAPKEAALPYRESNRAKPGSIPDALGKFFDQTFGRAFPSLVDQAGARAGDIARFRESEGASEVFKINRNIRQQLVKMASQPEAIKALVMDAIESPSANYKIRNPKLEKAVNFVKHESKAMGDALVKAGAIEGYLDNYLRHSFKDTPEQIELAIKKKSPTGNLSYFIERHGPDTYAIARELGLTPKETNPFKTFFDDFINKQKFLVAHNVIGDMMSENLVTKDAQPGYVKLNDFLRTATAKAKTGEAGDYYAPKSVADLLNNHLGEGFENNIGFREIRAMNNSMVQVQLGLSYFHGMFIMRDISNTLLGSGVTAIARGDFKEGIRQIGLGASPIYGQTVIAKNGSEFRAMISGEKPMTPEMEPVKKAWQLGGGRPQLSPEYINDSMLHMREAWEKSKDMNLDPVSRAFWGVKTIGEIPFSAIEMFAKPLMEHFVPNAKAGSFLELWKVQSKSLPKNATDAQIAVKARQLVNDIDDRMGQLVYSNLHMPSALRQSLTLVVRAGGWDIGSLRAIYGAGFDTVKAGKMLAQDAASKAGVLSEETKSGIQAKRESQGIFNKKDYFSQRMGYGVASAISMAITNGMITYLGNKLRNAVGKKPGEKDADVIPKGMDYVFPRIGDKRFSLAGYEKEVVEQYQIWKKAILHGDLSGISDYASQKASPIVNVGKSMATGKDWRNNRVSRTTALLDQYKSISMSGLGKPEGLESGGIMGASPLEAGLRFAGMTPASKHLIQTDAENKALDVLHGNKVPLSEQAADKSDFVNQLALYYRNGDKSVMEEAKKKGLLTPKDIHMVQLKSKDSDLLVGVMRGRSVPPDDALDIYQNYASDEEKKRLKGILMMKKGQALKAATPSERQAVIKKWSVVK